MSIHTLDHAGIAARVPHAGSMCLLHALHRWTLDEIECSAVDHTAPQHPLRTTHGLLAPAAIEYAAQAMALHGTLIAERMDPYAQPTPGFLASVRGVHLHVARLDTLPSPLTVVATRMAAQGSNILYSFAVTCDGQPVADGRATVVLNTPLSR
jgi:predicted hotdog family 3-hydroxylacyl-ACP dehydratase